jgi:hypothetical protein
MIVGDNGVSNVSNVTIDIAAFMVVREHAIALAGGPDASAAIDVN